MCPARRPGYTDQWLIPLLEEFARKYDFDAVHHDYVRYPGDAAPDRYCFCDYCLEHLPKWAGYHSEIHKEDPFFHEFYDRGYIEAHWEQSPRVLPANWDSLPRAFKAQFLLEGGFFHGGRNDLDYFFYLYRREAITDFCRLAKDAVSRANPKMQISAAVFKNPVHSGRFIGQDWRTFEGSVDGIIPMNYRDHYPGSFEICLDLLRETIGSQQALTKAFGYYWPGGAINFLFFEEERPLHAMKEALANADPQTAETEYAKVRNAIQDCAPETAFALDRMDGGAKSALSAFMDAIPAAYWPTDKLSRVIDVFEESGVDGFALFCVGHLDPYSQWDVLRNRLHP
jgi:hypothetical protein